MHAAPAMISRSAPAPLPSPSLPAREFGASPRTARKMLATTAMITAITPMTRRARSIPGPKNRPLSTAAISPGRRAAPLPVELPAPFPSSRTVFRRAPRRTSATMISNGTNCASAIHGGTASFGMASRPPPSAPAAICAPPVLISTSDGSSTHTIAASRPTTAWPHPKTPGRKRAARAPISPSMLSPLRRPSTGPSLRAQKLEGRPFVSSSPAVCSRKPAQSG